MKIKMKSNLHSQGSRPAAWPGDIIDMDDVQAKNLIQCGFAEAVAAAPENAAMAPAENAAMPDSENKSHPPEVLLEASIAARALAALEGIDLDALAVEIGSVKINVKHVRSAAAARSNGEVNNG